MFQHHGSYSQPFQAHPPTYNPNNTSFHSTFSSNSSTGQGSSEDLLNRILEQTK